jgi:hypothetical protein
MFCLKVLKPCQWVQVMIIKIITTRFIRMIRENIYVWTQISYVSEIGFSQSKFNTFTPFILPWGLPVISSEYLRLILTSSSSIHYGSRSAFTISMLVLISPKFFNNFLGFLVHISSSCFLLGGHHRLSDLYTSSSIFFPFGVPFF